MLVVIEAVNYVGSLWLKFRGEMAFALRERIQSCGPVIATYRMFYPISLLASLKTIFQSDA